MYESQSLTMFAKTHNIDRDELLSFLIECGVIKDIRTITDKGLKLGIKYKKGEKAGIWPVYGKETEELIKNHQFKIEKNNKESINNCINIINEPNNEYTQFITKFNNLLNQDKYIARSDYKELISDYKVYYDDLIVYNKNGTVLKAYSEYIKTSIDTLKRFIDIYDDIKDLSIDSKYVKKHNDEYINKHLNSEKEYLDNILKDDDDNIMLDDNQRRVVLSDEDCTMVIAGAGTGKTTTVEAKVKYLVDKQNIDPKDILIVTFTNKAVDELRTRIIDKRKIDCKICTFHSIGYNIVNKDSDKTPATEGYLFYVVSEYLKKNVLNQPDMVDSLVDFFAKYIETPFEDEKTLKDFFEFKTKGDYETLRSYINDYNQDDIIKLSQAHKTLDGEWVKSIEEAEIANDLYLNSINYEYEPRSPLGINDAKKLYTPDFIAEQNGIKVWIEHFGMINEDGTTNYSVELANKYKKAINEKIDLYKRNNTGNNIGKFNLIVTYNKHNDGRSYVEHIKDELTNKYGFKYLRRSNEEVYKKVVEIEESKYIKKLTNLIIRFINNYKSKGYSIDKIDDFMANTENPRNRIFYKLCRRCMNEYDNKLKERNYIDFQDMINDSIAILKDISNNKEKIINHYKYIIVDEYQDISNQRFQFTKTLADVLGAKVMVVGDDWQSIYAFSGSDVKLFIDFHNSMGYALKLDIVKTYRNSQELIDIAGNFVLKNKKGQIVKRLESGKPSLNKSPVVIKSYIEPNKDQMKQMKKEGKKGGLYYYLGLLVDDMIKTIISDMPELINTKRVYKKDDEPDILLIGRFGFDAENLGKNSDLFLYDNVKNKIKSVNYPNINIAFLTAHSSKGLSAKNVIIINALNDKYGFPSKIENDPLLKVVITEDKGIDYAEERRLFYVALTRTKNRVYIAVPENRPSEFIVELLTDKIYKNIETAGTINLNEIANNRQIRLCPICGAPLVYHYNKNYGLRLYMCTNEQELCGFMTNNLEPEIPMSIHKCDNCQAGFLIVQKGTNKFEHGSPYYLKCTKDCKNKDGKPYRISEAKYRHWLEEK